MKSREWIENQLESTKELLELSKKYEKEPYCAENPQEFFVTRCMLECRIATLEQILKD